MTSVVMCVMTLNLTLYFDIRTKLDYMNKLCTWHVQEQPLIVVKNDTIVENKVVDNKKFIPFVANRMVI